MVLTGVGMTVVNLSLAFSARSDDDDDNDEQMSFISTVHLVTCQIVISSHTCCIKTLTRLK